MKDVMTTFLKYDITIDKFMGDGVLAFSNAPSEQKNYVDRVLQAALEVLKKLEENNKIYADYWKEPMKVHMGMAQGTVRVGFFGDEQIHRSYTAIGQVVNLASRLCSVSGENELLVSKSVVEHVNNDQMVFEEFHHPYFEIPVHLSQILPRQWRTEYAVDSL